MIIDNSQLKTLIYNATIVNEGRSFRGSLLIDGDRIVEVREASPEAKPVMSSEFKVQSCLPTQNSKLRTQNCIDAQGAMLLPGIIDTHVHFREPGLTRKADIAHESRAALAGGVTSVMDMPNVNPPTTTLARWQERMVLGARESRVNYAYYLGATNTPLPLLPEMERLPIKLFMGSSTGNMLVDKRESLLAVFRLAAQNTTHYPLVTHCEDTPRINQRMAEAKVRWGEDPDVSHHPWIRDAEACYRSSSLAVELARETGARLHIAHITTEREVEAFTPLLRAGSGLSLEVCVPHLLFCDEDYATLGTRIKCNPAVKSRRDRDALRRALADGRLLTIATDHAPHLLPEKEGGCARAASGMPMVQFSLVAMLGLVNEGVLSIERMVDAMCHQPARLFSIKERGYLRPGYKADFVLVRPEDWTLRREDILSKCGWSPLEGQTLHWRVWQTYLNGRLAYDNGVIDDSIRGEYLLSAT